VNAVGRPGGEIEGRRGPRIDREEGAAISVSPRIPVNRRTGRLSSTRCPRNPGGGTLVRFPVDTGVME
jgi:hypothetical protein